MGTEGFKMGGETEGKNPKGERRDPDEGDNGAGFMKVREPQGPRTFEPDNVPGMGEDEIFCQKKGSRDPDDLVGVAPGSSGQGGKDPDQTRDPGDIGAYMKARSGSRQGVETGGRDPGDLDARMPNFGVKTGSRKKGSTMDPGDLPLRDPDDFPGRDPGDIGV